MSHPNRDAYDRETYDRAWMRHIEFGDTTPDQLLNFPTIVSDTQLQAEADERQRADDEWWGTILT